jgi:hypothetical protein
MIRRCHNPRHVRYQDYGGRGIVVCDEWRADYSAFIAHIGPRPSRNLTLERNDNSKGYEPGNVRWATYDDQNKNRRNVILVTYGGIEICLKDYCKKIGLSYKAVLARRRRGWTLERAIIPRSGRR